MDIKIQDNQNNNYEFEVDLDDTNEELKFMYSSVVPQSTEDKKVFKSWRNVLENNVSLLKAGIRENQTLYILSNSEILVEIKVVTFKIDIFNIIVNRNGTVFDIKKQIQGKLGLYPKQQILCNNAFSNELKDGKSLSECSDTLILIINLQGK